MIEEKGTARWREITGFLRTDILQGHYQPGQALPGEAFMADEYATSRPTIRKAIAQLVSEGLLTVAHGRGTFVRARPDRRLITFGSSPAEDLLSPAYDPAAQGWEHVTVPSDIERGNKLPHNQPAPMTAEGEDAEVLGIRRGRVVVYRYAYWQHAKTRHRIHLDSYVIADHIGTVKGEGADRDIDLHVESDNYYAHLEANHGPLRWATSVYTRMPYGDTYADLSMEPVGTPLLIIRRVTLSYDGRPLEFTEIEAPGDRFEASAITGDIGQTGGHVALRV
ncbi:GntR family transcriptional regulator [Sphaerisporangium sp. NPDC049003]|uniref:GntR family transcriptional regulator n=1 Tax=Sphaerisporangium sp. NPDC049003 TaxID=3364517 RepID=UPI0037113F6A